ncbi:MAG TPA: 30S ribosomal protein S9 [Saprospiraceae bacterium]|nr:30S ribosomal protein S9 [Saprospiraceae bacterium]HRO07618.1 30S ribosomal protein S9 [Saprospiraceae bacterium]HRO72055.1 30S ribosomal protein S9 [Saprospiraceae bacterium]HRP40901.1 30S ribosomal protein S9 [Saprospiraceae bacterium]
MEMINSIGRRKSSTARIYVTNGSGQIIINGKELKEYFPMPMTQATVLEPLKTTGVEGQYDIKINVSGGGFKGQAEAIRMGISRSLVKISEDNKKPLKEKKYLTRDAREVERKKFGKPKARKSFQFSKR